MSKSTWWAMLGVGVALLAGCGGQRTVATSVGQPREVGSVRCVIQWPPAARLVPSAAQSIELVLREGGTQLDRQVVARPSDGAPSAVTIGRLPFGNFQLTATAFPTADATGTPQAAGTAVVTITDATPVAVTLTMASTVATWVVTGTPEPLPVGRSFELVATARDTSGAVVLVPTASWVVASGTGVVSVTGPGAGGAHSAALHCDAGGTASVVARTQQQVGVAGSVLESAPVTIQVAALPTITASADATTVTISQPVALNATAVVDSALGRVVSYDWDLDGDGTYDRTNLSSPAVTTSYLTAGTRQATVRVTDNFGSVATASVAIAVTAATVGVVVQ